MTCAAKSFTATARPGRDVLMLGLENEAPIPTPSIVTERPDPARGATVHVRPVGSVLLFVAHAAGHVQGMTLT
jgi:hypothetical protein